MLGYKIFSTVSSGYFVLQSSKLNTARIQFRKFSTTRNQSREFKICNHFLSRACLQTVSRRFFRSKGERPGIDSKTSWVSKPKDNLLRSKPSGNANTKNGSLANFWVFAMKMGAYTAGFTVLAFGGCALWQRMNEQHVYEYRIKERANKHSNSKSQADLAYMWNHLSMVSKVTYGIIGLNLLVWAGWKVASQQTMIKWFTLSLNNTQQHFRGMFLSMFSHKSFIHLYVNMYVLSSFCVAWDRLSLKSNGNGHERFVAFYLTAGMCSGLLSLMVKYLGRIPHPSLGASGAIMGLVGYVCEKMPHTRLGIVFIPNWTFSAHSAKNFIIAFDAVGLLIGALSKWRYIFFDHAGHLGGILFGIWYARGGEQLLNELSQFMLRLQEGKR